MFAELSKVKLLMGIPSTDTSRDAALQCIVDMVNAEMLTLFCLDQVDSKVYTDVLDITERDDFQNFVKTRSYPIVDVIEVKDVNGTVYDPANLYHRPLGRIMLSSGCFRRGCQTTVATYTAGFESGSVPRLALGMAAVQAVIAQANTVQKAGFIEEQIGKYRYRLGGRNNSGLISPSGLPLAWGRIMCQYTRVFQRGS